MMNVVNFTSLFEVSFAINALFYFFEVLPLQRKKDKSELDEFDRSFVELENSGFKGFDKQNEYFKKGLIEYQSNLKKSTIGVTIFNSILSLGMLISVGFYPGFNLAWYILVFIIILLFLLPSFLYIIGIKYRNQFNLFVIDRLVKRADKNF